MHFQLIIHLPSTGIQLVPREKRCDDFQRSQLLLPLRQPGSHHGARRHPQILLVSVQTAEWMLSILISKKKKKKSVISFYSFFLFFKACSLILHPAEESLTSPVAPQTTSCKPPYWTFVHSSQVLSLYDFKLMPPWFRRGRIAAAYVV